MSVLPRIEDSSTVAWLRTCTAYIHDQIEIELTNLSELIMK